MMRRYVKTFEAFSAGPLKLYVLFEPTYLEKYWNGEDLSFDEIKNGMKVYSFYDESCKDQFIKGMDYAKDESFVSTKVVSDEKTSFYRLQLLKGESEYPQFEADDENAEDDDELNRLMSKSDTSYNKDIEEILFYDKNELKAFMYGIEQAEGWFSFETFDENEFQGLISNFTPDQKIELKRVMQIHHVR